MNCPKCGKFMTEGLEIDSPLEDEVVKWWFCKCGEKHLEHLYFKSTVGSDNVELDAVEALKEARNAEADKDINLMRKHSE